MLAATTAVLTAMLASACSPEECPAIADAFLQSSAQLGEAQPRRAAKASGEEAAGRGGTHAFPPILRGLLEDITRTPVADFSGRQDKITNFLSEVFGLRASTESTFAHIQHLVDSLRPSGWDIINVSEMGESGLREMYENEFKGILIAKPAHRDAVLLEHRQFLNHTGCDDWWRVFEKFFMPRMGYGNFCGYGDPQHCSERKLPMVEGYGGKRVCDDGGLDNICARHDSGRLTWDLWGFASVSLCEVDMNLLEELSRFLSSAEKDQFDDGSYDTYDAALTLKCVYAAMPCYHWEARQGWGWCPEFWGGLPCRKKQKGWVTRWPPHHDLPPNGCKGDCYK